MSKRLPTVWPAEPHTVAKIEILKGYLHAWFRILGKTRPGETLLYVDGFAGPGYYTNHDEGSPLAALRVAEGAITSLDGQFAAKELHCVFIEADPKRYDVLKETVAPFVGKPRLTVTHEHCEFVTGIGRLSSKVPGPFLGKGPLFVFADPFGATMTPFRVFADCMRGDTAELLINLDADGAGRILAAESNNRHDEQMDALFGGDCWKKRLTARGDLPALSLQILDLYKERLRTLHGVKYVWSFAMRSKSGKSDTLNYHLVFATKHPLGMKKMKEAMRKIDGTGAYSFSDAHIAQQVLFRDDNDQVYADKLFAHFDGKTATPDDVETYALNETPFTSAKPMLILLQKKGRLEVEAVPGEKLKAGTFPDGKVKKLRFGKFAVCEEQGVLSI